MMHPDDPGVIDGEHSTVQLGGRMNSTVALCSACGQPLPPDMGERWDSETRTFTCAAGSVRFSPRLALFFQVLYRRRRQGAIYNARDLCGLAYASEADGGPISAEVSAVVAINQIRAMLAPLGWTVTHNVGRPKVGFRLVPL